MPEGRPGPTFDWSVAGRAKPGEAVSGDVATACQRDGRLVLAVIDGLGHGPSAAAAAAQAAVAVEEYAAEPPAALLAMVHKRLVGTRGAAATVAALDVETGRLDWLGVGNVDGVVVRADATARPAVTGVFLAAGVLGAQLPPLRAMTSVELGHGDTVVLATDGVRVDLADAARSTLRASALAERILADHASPTDDALVLVARRLDPGAPAVSERPGDPVTDYTAALAAYVERGREHELEAAFTLGRQAVADGMTILGLVDQHRAAVDVLARACAHLDPRRVEATFQFLSEALATFDMAQRGYWEAKEMAARERAIALMLQHELLPPSLPDVAGLDVAVRYLPGEATSQAGGDWYDLFPLPDGQVGLVVGDVTGHGVAAAASMGQMRMAVLAYALAGFPPGDVVERVDVLVEALGRGHVATMVYAIADVAAHELVVANAGHPLPIIVPRDGPSVAVDAGQGLLLGLDPALNRRAGETVAVPPGSQVLFYTDGLIEPLERREEDGVARLLEVTSGFRGTPDDLCELVLGALTPDQSGDDICTLAITFTP